jgi:hypothetical protein
MFKQVSFFDDLIESSPSTVLDLLKVHFEIQRLLPSSTCPKDPNLPLKFDCEIKGKNRTPRLKYMCPLPLRMGGSYLRDSKTTKADFFMSGIAHLVIVYVAFKAGLLDKVRCVKSIAA